MQCMYLNNLRSYVCVIACRRLPSITPFKPIVILHGSLVMATGQGAQLCFAKQSVNQTRETPTTPLIIIYTIC